MQISSTLVIVAGFGRRTAKPGSNSGGAPKELP